MSYRKLGKDGKDANYDCNDSLLQSKIYLTGQCREDIGHPCGNLYISVVGSSIHIKQLLL